MIRTEKAYQESIKKLEESQKIINAQEAELQKLGVSAQNQIRAMAPMLHFDQQIRNEIKQYERIKQGDLSDFKHLEDLGKLLIAMRISKGLTQRDLAERLGVSEAQVSRDERNEYFGITNERAIRILQSMNESVNVSVPQDKGERQLVT